MNMALSCDIIIPVFNKPDLTGKCLKSIYENTCAPFNLIIIDNNSASDVRKFLEDFKNSRDNVTLIRNQNNLGWIKGVNQGLRLSKAPYVCIMNNDTVVNTSGWLSRLIGIAESEMDIGLVNPTFDIKRDLGAKSSFIEVDFCRGYCVLIKRPVIEKIGLLDEAYGEGYYDDDDYSVRALRAGFRCVRANDVFVRHFGDSTFSEVFGESKRRLMHAANKKLFYSKWGRRLKIVFVARRYNDKDKLQDLFLSLARKQHIIYVRGVNFELSSKHINIRQKLCSRPASLFWIYAMLFLNRLKKSGKRYDLAFVDSEAGRKGFFDFGFKVHYVDLPKDLGRILKIAEAEARA